MTQFVYLPKRQILQRVVFNNLLRQYSFYQNSKDFRKPIKTVSIDSPADLDRTTTQGLGKANPMVEVIDFFYIPKIFRNSVSNPQFRLLHQRRTTDCSRMHDLHWVASLQTCVSSSCHRPNMLLPWNPTLQHQKNRVSLIIFTAH